MKFGLRPLAHPATPVSAVPVEETRAARAAFHEQLRRRAHLRRLLAGTPLDQVVVDVEPPPACGDEAVDAVS